MALLIEKRVKAPSAFGAPDGFTTYKNLPSGRTANEIGKLPAETGLSGSGVNKPVALLIEYAETLPLFATYANRPTTLQLTLTEVTFAAVIAPIPPETVQT